MTTFLDDEIGRVPGESVIPTDTAAILAANPAWTLTGDVWSTVTTEDVTTLEWVGDAALTPRMSYVLTIEALTDVPVSLRWTATVTYDDEGVLTVADGAANIDPTTPIDAGAWVETARAFDAPDGVVSGHFATEVTAPIGTSIQLRAPFVAPLDGPLEIRAGAISAETINGGAFTGETFTGGEFVGGEFRTSDTLPGQVTLSDTAAQGKPGLSVEPEDATGYDVLPSIGPDATSMHIRGGVAVDGSLAGASFDPTGSSIYHNGPGETGTGSWALVNGSEARLAYRDDRTNAAYESGMWVRPSSAQLYREDAQGVGYARADIGHVGLDYYPSGGSSGAHSRIRASTTDVVVSRRDLAGVRRALRVDDTGVWVDFNTGPFTDTLVSHNLLPTVTTSPFTMPSGWEPDGANAAKYTITGGACWWAGVVKSTGTVASGWTTLGYAPEDAWPKDGDQLRTLPTTTGRTVLGKISAADGRIEIWIDQSSTGVFMHFSPFTYLV